MLACCILLYIEHCQSSWNPYELLATQVSTSFYGASALLGCVLIVGKIQTVHSESVMLFGTLGVPLIVPLLWQLPGLTLQRDLALGSRSLLPSPEAGVASVAAHVRLLHMLAHDGRAGKTLLQQVAGIHCETCKDGDCPLAAIFPKDSSGDGKRAAQECVMTAARSHVRRLIRASVAKFPEEIALRQLEVAFLVSDPTGADASLAWEMIGVQEGTDIDIAAQAELRHFRYWICA